MSLGLDTFIIVVLVIVALGALFFLQRASSRKAIEPSEQGKK